MSLVIPTIHLNGSSRESLIEALCNASNALHQAREALQLCGPHGRDYYVQGGDATQRAIDAHVARLVKIESVQEEVIAIAAGISDQR